VVWAAVTAAAQVIPTIPMALGLGGSFSFATALAPLAGIFFGPIYGVLCAAAGGFAGSIIAPHNAWLGLAHFIIGAVSAFTAGCIAWGGWPPVKISLKGNFIINGGIIVFLLGTILWFSNDIGRRLPMFPVVFYGLGLAALIAGSMFAGKFIAGKNHLLKFPGVMLCAFGGMAASASIANFFFLMIHELPDSVWALLTVQAPAERFLFSIGTALVGVPLLICLPKVGIFIGPQEEPEEEPPAEEPFRSASGPETPAGDDSGLPPLPPLEDSPGDGAARDETAGDVKTGEFPPRF